MKNRRKVIMRFFLNGQVTKYKTAEGAEIRREFN